MSFNFASLIPIAGGLIGNAIAPGVGAAIGSSIGGAVGGSLAQQQAGKQAQSTLEQSRANFAPWVTTGQQANAALGDFLGTSGGGFNANAPGLKPFGLADFRADPGYNWAKKQGEQSVLNRRSRLGGVLSGGTLTDLTEFGQGLADQQYQQAYNRYNTNVDNIFRRLYGVSGLGENAAGGYGNNAAGVAGVQQGIGNAASAGAVGVGSGITDAVNNWLLTQAIQGRLGGGNVPASIPSAWPGVTGTATIG